MSKSTKKLLLCLLFVVCASAILVALSACDILNGLFEQHTHNYTETIIEPTCTSDGYTIKKCECGDEKRVDTVSALGHDYATQFTIDKTATCASVGEKSRHCTRCDAKIDVTIMEELGHDYATYYTVDQRATCDTDGSESKHCSRCSSTMDTRAIPMLGHDYSQTKTIDVNATCTTDGSQSRHCSRCNSKIDIESIPRLGHNFSTTATVDKAATCTENGQKSRHCLRCSAITDTETIAKLGHDIISSHVVEATCTNQGYTQYVCSRCEGYKEDIVSALGHSMKNGKCARCSFEDPSYYSFTKCQEEPYVWNMGTPCFSFTLTNSILNAIKNSPDKELTITVEFELMYSGVNGVGWLYDGWKLGGDMPYLSPKKENGDKFFFPTLKDFSLSTTSYTKLTCTINVLAKQIIGDTVYFFIPIPNTMQRPNWYIKNLTLSMGFES